MTTRKDKEVADARKREAESRPDVERLIEKREMERKTDEYLALLQREQERRQ
jgi:hypothetical protein